MMALEPYLAVMAGCSGVAFNTSGHDNYRLMEVLHGHKADMTADCATEENTRPGSMSGFMNLTL